MQNIDDIKTRCESIINETQRGSISPQRIGNLLKDITECIEEAHVSNEITNIATI